MLGALLVLGGVGWLVQQLDLVEVSLATMLSTLLIALGIGLVATARRAGGGGGLVALGLALTVALASVSAVDVGLLQKGVGERSFVPTDAGDLESNYQLGVGSLTLDLTELDAAAMAGRRVRVQVAMGELIVVLPPAEVVGVEIIAEAQAGELDLFSNTGEAAGGTNVRGRYEDPPSEIEAEQLELDLDVGLGSIQVVRSRP
ncbi:MAG: hypothetical protein M3Q68_04710 [Actinomycetota bacterium]|nr:hypothetical protein [Actinomycetota bacterium]